MRRSGIAIITGSVLLLLIGVFSQWRGAETPAARPRPPAAPPASQAVPLEEGALDRQAPAPAPAARTTAKREESPAGPLDADGEEMPHGTWEALDLEDVRKAMPDNSYWKMAAPTKDPELLEWREKERARWNVEYGKVLSNTATAEEIDAYYAERKRISDDYLEFVVYVITNYGNAIPREGLNLLKLAGEMHAMRLEEIPRQMAEAHARAEAHDAARRAWLEEQKEFAQPPAGEP
jgi:hypothetical protein